MKFNPPLDFSHYEKHRARKARRARLAAAWGFILRHSTLFSFLF